MAVTFLLFGHVGREAATTTVIQQAPASAAGFRNANQTGSAGPTPHAIYRRTAAGVVFVAADVVQRSGSPFDTDPGASEATGSGFVIDGKGRILTNYHLVAGATRVTVAFEDKKTVAAQIVGTDPSKDIALLKVDPAEHRLDPLQLGDSSSVRVGDPVLAIGNPFGFDRTLTSGIVSAMQRQIEAPNGFSIDDVIQTDAAINPGNSGGPLLDAAGRVIGINSQIAAGRSGGATGIAFAVPVDTARGPIPASSSAPVARARLAGDHRGATVEGKSGRDGRPRRGRRSRARRRRRPKAGASRGAASVHRPTSSSGSTASAVLDRRPDQGRGRHAGPATSRPALKHGARSARSP